MSFKELNRKAENKRLHMGQTLFFSVRIVVKFQWTGKQWYLSILWITTRIWIIIFGSSSIRWYLRYPLYRGPTLRKTNSVSYIKSECREQLVAPGVVTIAAGDQNQLPVSIVLGPTRSAQMVSKYVSWNLPAYQVRRKCKSLGRILFKLMRFLLMWMYLV